MPGDVPDGRSRPRCRGRPLLLTGTAVAIVTVGAGLALAATSGPSRFPLLGGPAGIAQRGQVGARATVGPPRLRARGNPGPIRRAVPQARLARCPTQHTCPAEVGRGNTNRRNSERRSHRGQPVVHYAKEQ